MILVPLASTDKNFPLSVLIWPSESIISAQWSVGESNSVGLLVPSIGVSVVIPLSASGSI